VHLETTPQQKTAFIEAWGEIHAAVKPTQAGGTSEVTFPPINFGGSQKSWTKTDSQFYKRLQKQFCRLLGGTGSHKLGYLADHNDNAAQHRASGQEKLQWRQRTAVNYTQGQEIVKRMTQLDVVAPMNVCVDALRRALVSQLGLLPDAQWGFEVVRRFCLDMGLPVEAMGLLWADEASWPSIDLSGADTTARKTNTSRYHSSITGILRHLMLIRCGGKCAVCLEFVGRIRQDK